MSEFERHWSNFYFKGAPFAKGANIEFFINNTLDEEDKLTILTSSQGQTRVSITSQMAAELNLEDKQTIKDVRSFRTLLSKAGIELHSPDNVYFSGQPATFNSMAESIVVRKLTEDDEPLYSEFTRGIDPAELDNAWVELDHWAVFGLFLNGKLVSACSLYPWQKTNIADLGVITLAEFRGKGLAKTLVKYAHQQVSKEGYILQYRSQVDNVPSIKLAQALELSFYGVWESIVDNSDS